MAEIVLPGQGPEAPSEQAFSRRCFLHYATWIAGGIVGVSAAGGAIYLGGKSVFESNEDQEGRQLAGSLLESDDNDGLHNWHKFTIVPLLLQIDPSVRVTSDMFGSPDSAVPCPPGGYFLAFNTIAVKKTLLRNIADYDPGTQSSVGRALPSIPEGLLAFYEPDSSNFVYLDADANDGLITPITGNAISGNRLDVVDIDITSRFVQGDIIYPYIGELGVAYKQLGPDFEEPEGTESFNVIGHSCTVAGYDQLQEVIGKYLFEGINPVSLPKP